MVVYEVNLRIKDEIYSAFMNWLEYHANEMLNFKGFKNFKILHDTDNQYGLHNVTVVYDVSTMDNLNTYLNHHSAAMRDDGISKFGNKFSASRRILVSSDALCSERATI
ncbi:DUF4286 family protein [Fangia hongkongensis]|uniref:DUF4286 family protein n=1 Tax=Fangia hongkongensis TaxID=270495 RepID=UPI0014699E8C|nr:DUF4286 family protein [Fangia hongkongensis]MBK2124463.1 DUF4286 family protein [Fangia hongkongensis]